VTANETSASKYMIEQSADNKEFTLVGTVASQNGANNVYTFVDSKPKMGQSFYRIHQMTPANEDVFMSKTEKVMLMEAGKSIIVYPNPVGSILFVEVVDAQNTEGVIYVYNSLGSLVKKQDFVKDQIRYTLELGDLAQGTYIVRVRQTDGKTATAKITKL
jgi:Secretion system C-terminal sorting domain